MDTRPLEYNLICVKWGDKFSPEHVNRLYRMAKKNISLPFNFYCWTEDATGLYDEINIVALDETLDLKAWWWKLTLFKENKLTGVNLYLDLDVVIQNNIDRLFNLAKHNKLTLIDRSIFPLKDHENNYHAFDPEFNDELKRDFITKSMYNSSIMVWYNNENRDLYNKFNSNYLLYTSFYFGIDRFFTYEINTNKFEDIGIENYYFRNAYLEGFFYTEDQQSSIEYRDKAGSHKQRVYHDKDKSICVFNSCHEDYFYKGMEDYLL